MASIYCAKTTASRDENQLSFGIWCAYISNFTVDVIVGVVPVFGSRDIKCWMKCNRLSNMKKNCETIRHTVSRSKHYETGANCTKQKSHLTSRHSSCLCRGRKTGLATSLTGSYISVTWQLHRMRKLLREDKLLRPKKIGLMLRNTHTYSLYN